MDFREGDWMCPVCGDVNFGARQLCRKCNTIRPDLIATLTTTRYDIEENQTNPASGGGGVSGGESEGHIMTEEETIQAQLQAMQQIQAFKAIQQQIQAIQALTQAAHTGTLYSGGMAMPPVAKQNTKPGDWFCPTCKELNFASRQLCRRCNTPHPPYSDPTIGTKPGDWYCPSCRDLNFASRSACRKCGTQHPGGTDPTLRLAFAAAAMPPVNSKPGDWHCTNCAHLNFASRTACRMCNTPRGPTSAMVGVKPGDWFCSKCNELNFASRTHCRKCASPRG